MSDDSRFTEKCLESNVIYQGQVLKYQVDKVLLPNAKTSVREMVLHPGAICVVPVLPDGRIVFVRQYRYPIKQVLYELPAGKLDKGENPDNCAARELQEETGYSSLKIEKMGKIVTVPGFCDEIIHIYKATELVLGDSNPDDDEIVDTVILSEEQIQTMVKNGQIYDAKTLSSLFFYNLNK